MPDIIQYNDHGYEQMPHKACADLTLHNDGTITWLNLEETTGAEFNDLVSYLNLHPLLVEDLRSSLQLPKYELFEDLGYLSLQMIRRNPSTKMIVNEHVSVLIKGNLLVTIQEGIGGDVFENLRQKLKLNFKRISKNGIDYLFLLLVDAMVDEYLTIVDSYRSPVEDLELAMVKRPAVNVMKRIMEHKAELNRIRKFTVPLREEMQRIRTENPDFIKKQNQALYRDIMDHLNMLVSNYESMREMLRDLSDLNHSNQNLVMNNTMKTLTGISAVFIPLTFIVGVYGMNFKYFPELEWKEGYYIIWGIMISIAIGMIWYMKKRRWF
ncbi:MAG: magnesium/cobalt transporter CorA [Bacteroidia bacterium]|jgi:magnesium transporter|nr:magnesium/cobalt transporter CorA [Bacteroidia bacterium]